jgi:hypothetical protein
LQTRGQRLLLSCLAVAVSACVCGFIYAPIDGLLFQGISAAFPFVSRLWPGWGKIPLSELIAGGLFTGLVGGAIGSFGELRPVDRLSVRLSVIRGRASKSLRSGLRQGLIAGLACWAILATLALPNLLSGRRPDLVNDLIFTGTIFGLVVGLSGGLVKFLTTEAVEARRRPNQGTSESAKSGFVAQLIFAQVGSWIDVPTYPAPFFGPIVGSVGWLFSGGLFATRHVLVRLMLSWRGVAPLNYVSFLDYATERFFLHKVGGGYVFVHRTLMEYFVSLQHDR